MNRSKWLLAFFGLLLLFLAHGMALVFRIQPAVSLWFPPAGVAIALTLWLGPLGLVLTGIVSVTMAPFWGSDGWTRLVGLTDVIEPFLVWLIYRRWWRGSLNLKGLQDVLIFLVSAPLVAAAASAISGSVALRMLGQIPAADFWPLFVHWWVGNAIGTLAITPAALIFGTPLLHHWGLLHTTEPESSFPEVHSNAPHRWVEIGFIVAGILYLAFLTVAASKSSIFLTLQFSLLSSIPIIWAASRFGVKGGVLSALFSVLVTLLNYVLIYPDAITLAVFPVNAELLRIHKLSLLFQGAIGLVVGTVVTEQAATQAALAVEQVRLAEYQATAQLSEKLFHLNRLLTETNQQMQQSEECFRASVENMLDCFGIYSAVRDQGDRIIDFRVDYVNEAACNSNRMTREHQLGRGLCEILPAHRESGLFDEYCQVVETGQPLIKDSILYEDEFGKQRLIRAFDIRISKLGDGFVATWRDVTPLKQIETALRLTNERFQLAASAVSSLIYDWDVEADYMARSEGLKDLLNYLPNEVEATNDWWSAQIHPDDRQHIPNRLEATPLTDDRYALEYRIKNKQGQYVHVLDQGLVLRNPSGKPIRVVGSVTNISSRKQMEEALRESEERLRLALKAANQGLYDLNVQTGQAIVSPEYAEMLGYPPDQFQETNEKWRDRLHPDDLERVYQVYSDYVAGQTDEYRVEFRQRTQTGQWKWILSLGKIIEWDAAGQPLRMVGTHTDVTKRKQVEEALRLSEARSRRLIDSNLVGVLFSRFDGQVLEANDAFLQMVGYDHDEISSLNWRTLTPPEYMEQDEQAIADIQAVGVCVPFEKEYIRKDGSRVPVLLGKARLMETDDEAVSFVLDLSQRKHNEEALRRNRERFNLALEAAGMGTWNWYIQTNELQWSPKLEELFGFAASTADRTFESFMHHVHEGDRDSLMHAIRRAVYEKEEFSVEFRFVQPNGSLCWIIGKGRVFYDTVGKPVQMTGVCLDITERKRIEEERADILVREQAARQQAEAASRMKDEFLAIVSHELRSPLNGILGWSRLLRTRKLSAEKTDQALASIERNAQAQTQLIEDLLDISRIIRGTIRLYPRPTNLVPVLQAALDTVRPVADSRSITLETHLDSEVGLVSGDSERLQQIVWNLLSNAVKFTPDNGQVKLYLEQITDREVENRQPGQQDTSQGFPSTYARIRIVDTGKGIQPEFLPYVFDRFRQADSTTTRSEGGLGLGLAIVHNLVELQGGRVYANSGGIGQGATFVVEFPTLAENNSIPSEVDPSDANLSLQSEPLQGLQVLIVDDEADTRDFLATALEQFGAQVMVASSAQEALSLLRQERPDVLLSDIGMPEADGYDLIQQVRALPQQEGGATPAAALTAYVRGGDRQRALDAGFQMHIPKPVEPIQLLKVVKRLSGRLFE